jgi:hypothetical protein
MEEWGLVFIFLVIIIVVFFMISSYNPNGNPSSWNNNVGTTTFDDFSNTNDNHNTFESDNSSGYDSDSSGGDSSGGDSD